MKKTQINSHLHIFTISLSSWSWLLLTSLVKQLFLRKSDALKTKNTWQMTSQTNDNIEIIVRRTPFEFCNISLLHYDSETSPQGLPWGQKKEAVVERLK